MSKVTLDSFSDVLKAYLENLGLTEEEWNSLESSVRTNKLYDLAEKENIKVYDYFRDAHMVQTVCSTNGYAERSCYPS